MRFPLTATRLRIEGDDVEHDPAGDLVEAVERHLRGGTGRAGLVVLGTFGSGKTQLCATVASQDAPDRPPCTVVPLRVVARHGSVAEGLLRVVGNSRLEEARAGRGVLLLDGLDEVARPGDGSFPGFFESLIAQVGPRWVLTSRPGHFRTDASEPGPDQVDVLARADVETLTIDPISEETAYQVVARLPGGVELLRSVEGLKQLATSPLLLHVVHAALPYIEPGRPIQPWGVFDAWIRHALSTGAGHDEAVARLEALAWSAFRDTGFSSEGASFPPDAVGAASLPATLRRALLVTDLDGRLRFGHRSVYEFLLAAQIAPQLAANQGEGPDALSGLRISEATRVFLVGRVGPMPVVYEGRRVRIPRGNFVAGGDFSSDERPLRIEHLARPFWIAREPVTNEDWSLYLDAGNDRGRVDVHYLAHWGPRRRVPRGQEHAPVHNVWPEDADRYAAWAGARLPSADEWEKAVRGIDGRRWPWGDSWRPGLAVTAETRVSRPLPVHAFGAHGDAGLFSVIGGVFEYTSSPWRGRRNRGRVVMGGCYTHDIATSRAGLRLSHKLSGNLKAGLRLAWDG